MKIKIEKLVFGGQAIAHHEGNTFFVWNALPDEEVEVEIIKKRKNIIEAIATKIISPSPLRVEPKEAHFLSSSPWQILNFQKENEWKENIARETYSKIGDMLLHEGDARIFSDNKEFGYRNKIEYSFTLDPNNPEKVTFGFFERGKKKIQSIHTSLLCEEAINITALEILEWINEQKIPLRSLKSIILRSNGQGKVIAALFIKDKLEFSTYPKLNDSFLGFTLYYSTHKSPASVPTALLYTEGQNFLTAKIFETQLKFGLLSFFQVNIPVFQKALDDVAAFLDPKLPLVDFYSGVGAISLPLSLNREKTILVESNEEAVNFAKENITLNNLKNCEAHCAPAEKMTEFISSDKQIIVDPPRVGLHNDVIHALLRKQPPKILYLSCDVATQARDLRLLGSHYRLTFLKLYNFFPRTPHIEGLAVLER